MVKEMFDKIGELRQNPVCARNDGGFAHFIEDFGSWCTAHTTPSKTERYHITEPRRWDKYLKMEQKLQPDHASVLQTTTKEDNGHTLTYTDYPTLIPAIIMTVVTRNDGQEDDTVDVWLTAYSQTDLEKYHESLKKPQQ